MEYGYFCLSKGGSSFFFSHLGDTLNPIGTAEVAIRPYVRSAWSKGKLLVDIVTNRDVLLLPKTQIYVSTINHFYCANLKLVQRRND